MFKRDLLVRQLERLGDMLARIFKLKTEQNLDQAFDEVTMAYEEIFQKHKALIAYADSSTLASVLGDDGLVRGLAQLSAAEAELFEVKGDPITAEARRRRALELYLEAELSSRQKSDREAIRALAARVPVALLAERYQRAL